jgi:hypothetical protein
MLTEYMHDHARIADRELRELAQSRPRYDRSEGRGRSRARELLRRVALHPAKATSVTGGRLPDVVIRPAAAKDFRAIARLAEASERRLPSGLVLVAEVDSDIVAALPAADSYVLTDLLRPTSDVVQLLELRSEQLRAAHLDKVA